MEFLYLAIAVLSVAIVYLLQDRADVKRQIALRKTLETLERQERDATWPKIIARLDLRNADLPKPDASLFSTMLELYEYDPNFDTYPQRVKWARDNDGTYVYYWDVEGIDELYDGELIELWLIGVIECPA